jgi:photosystem II stability/assembly factor-like uncharacterized protein
VGPFGGGAEVVAIHPSQTSTIYTLTKNAFLYRSLDDGASWSLIRFPAQLAATGHALLLDAARPERLFVGVSSPLPGVAGAYQSLDAGKTWRAIPELKGNPVFSLAAFPGNTDVLAAGAKDGVFLSRDGGQSWNRISPKDNRELQPVMSLGFDPRKPEILYAGTPHLPWKTNDFGQSWLSIHKGMIDDSDILALTVSQKHPTRLFIGACSGIYRSDNSAQDWRKLLGIVGPGGFRTYAVALDPVDADIVYSGTRGGLYKSRDGGKAWQKLSSHIVKSIAIAPDNPKRLYLATEDAGVIRSTDGGSGLKAAQNGLVDRRVNQLALAGSALYVTAGQDFAVLRQPPSSPDWSRVPLPPLIAGGRVQLLSHGRDLFAWTAQSLWRLSANTWVRQTAPAGTLTGLGLSGDHLFAATTKAVFRANDQAQLWTSLSPLPPAAGTIRRLAVSAAQKPHTLLWVETAAGHWMSADSGKSWLKSTLDVPPAEINELALAPGLALAATARGLMQSRDLGQTWTLAPGLDASTVASVAIHPLRPNAAFVAQWGRVLETADAGASWREWTQDGLEGASILSLLVSAHGSSPQVLALTAARGVFAHALGDRSPVGAAPGAGSNQDAGLPQDAGVRSGSRRLLQD